MPELWTDSPESDLPGELSITGPKTAAQAPVLREKTTANIAYIVVLTFALCILGCFGTVFYYVRVGQDLESSFELFKTVSAVMSGPLGFVLGFYFRER
jgi:hypothetical protein